MPVITSTTGLAKAGGVKLLPYALVAAAALSALSAVGGFYAGREFERGQVAIAALPALRADASALAEQADSLRRESVAAQDRFRRSALSLELVRTRYEDSLHEIERIAAAQGAALDAYLAARPELDAVRLDADGVRLWNAAARGTEAAQPAAAGASGRAASDVPGAPAGAAGGRERGGHAAGVDQGGRAAPQLPQGQAKPVGGAVDL
jgi:hypothetical protein